MYKIPSVILYVYWTKGTFISLIPLLNLPCWTSWRRPCLAAWGGREMVTERRPEPKHKILVVKCRLLRNPQHSYFGGFPFNVNKQDGNVNKQYGDEKKQYGHQIKWKKERHNKMKHKNKFDFIIFFIIFIQKMLLFHSYIYVHFIIFPCIIRNVTKFFHSSVFPVVFLHFFHLPFFRSSIFPFFRFSLYFLASFEMTQNSSIFPFFRGILYPWWVNIFCWSTGISQSKKSIFVVV